MTALAAERTTSFAGLVPARGTYPIAANTIIYRGSLVALDSAGRAIPANTVANGALKCVGKASSTFDNRTGSEAGGGAGAMNAEVEFGTFGWATATGGGDDIAADDIGKVAYMVDDQTVALTDGGAGARRPAGVITEVRDGQIWVWSGPHVAALISGAAL